MFARSLGSPESNSAPATSEEAERYEALRRVWREPTEEESSGVLQWARRIAGDPHKSFAWQKTSSLIKR